MFAPKMGKLIPAGGTTMKKKTAIGLLAGACLLVGTFPFTAAAAGKGNGAGQMGGSQLRTQDRAQDQSRLRDGSGLNSTATQAGSMQKRGNTYGPGDGTGNAGVGPKDGTGYGPGPR
jgi:hypothetical protein